MKKIFSFVEYPSSKYQSINLRIDILDNWPLPKKHQKCFSTGYPIFEQ